MNTRLRFSSLEARAPTQLRRETTLTEIAASYAPYHTVDAFGEGFAAYQNRLYANPYDGRPADGVKAQAWDRGLEAGSRATRAGLI